MYIEKNPCKIMYASIISLVYIGLPTLILGQTVNKLVEADCRRDPDVSSITLTMYIAFNGDPVDKFLALSGDTFVRNPDGSTNEVDCQYTGTLASDGGILVTSTVYYDGKTGINVCGGRKYPDGTTATQYKWTFEVRERYLDGIYTDRDRRYGIVCNLDNTHGNFAIPSSVVYVFGEDDVGTAERVRPENQMSVLERTGTSSIFGQEVITGVNIGQQVKLRVQTKIKVSGLRRANIDHYGVYVFSCDYRTGFTAQRTQFIQLNGCPNTVFSDLTSGFKYAQFAASNEINYRYFQTETSPFVLARSTPANNFLYIGCYVGYCYGPEGTDAKCNDYCASNPRFRRSLNNTAEMDRISITVRINDQDQSEPWHTVSAQQTTIIVISSTVAIAGFVVILALMVLLCMWRHRRAQSRWASSSTTSSIRNLPAHLSDDQFKEPKF